MITISNKVIAIFGIAILYVISAVVCAIMEVKYKSLASFTSCFQVAQLIDFLTLFNIARILEGSLKSRFVPMCCYKLRFSGKSNLKLRMFTLSGGVKTKILKASDVIELSDADAKSTAVTTTLSGNDTETANISKMKSKNSWIKLEEPRYVPESVDI